MHSHPSPKFSVITVTYNAEKVLEDTVQSVISQTYHHVEYIIIDGASKDGTLEIVNRYRNRINQLVSEPDKGRLSLLSECRRQFPRRRHFAKDGSLHQWK